MAKRTDRNQSEIVRALRQAGATVTATHEIGKGFPDLAVGYRQQNFLIEIKDPLQPPSRKRLTPDEKQWHEAWRGSVVVVETPEDALRHIGAIK